MASLFVIIFQVCLFYTSVEGHGHLKITKLEGTIPPDDDGCTDSPFRGIINFCNSDSSQGCSLTREGVEPKCYAIGSAIIIITIIIIIIIATIICYCKRRSHCNPLRKDDIDTGEDRKEHRRRNEERQEQETAEQKAAFKLAKSLSKERYDFVKKLAPMGSRLQRYWYELKDKGTEERCIQTITPYSSSICPIPIGDSETVETINDLFEDLKQHHRHLHIVCGLRFEQGQVSIVQPFMESGSLRDMIYKEGRPTEDWADKYLGQPHILPLETVRKCGGHVLEAVYFLYKKGFPPLGHIHTGNIFPTEEGDFVLGGYENTLLGYRTRPYRKIIDKNYLEKIDVIMFGHVIYEMSSGHVLSGVFPTEEEYERVEYEEVKELLHFIFNLIGKKLSPQKMIMKIREHSFFKELNIKVRYRNVLQPKQKRLLAVVRGESPPNPPASSNSGTRRDRPHRSKASSMSEEDIPLGEMSQSNYGATGYGSENHTSIV